MNRPDSMADDTAKDPNARPGAGPLASTCRHLRSNGLFIFDALPDDDEYESSGCWCQRTMKLFGPDDDLVGRRECRDAGRSCYEPL